MDRVKVEEFNSDECNSLKENWTTWMCGSAMVGSGLMDTPTSAMGGEGVEKRLILIREFPFTLYLQNPRKFTADLQNSILFLKSSQDFLGFVFSFNDTRENFAIIYRLFDESVLISEKVYFKPVCNTGILKVLAHHFSNISKKSAQLIAETSNGDVRQALNCATLYNTTSHPITLGQKGGKRGEDAIDFFHAIGRILNCKRYPRDCPESIKYFEKFQSSGRRYSTSGPKRQRVDGGVRNTKPTEPVKLTYVDLCDKR